MGRVASLAPAFVLVLCPFSISVTYHAASQANSFRPLCGQHHFEENDDFEECPVCGWVNDGVQRADPDYRGGYNRISLNEAKKKFAAGKKVFD